ncbi:polysaccharide biosynthesis/export protein [Oleiphilus messinensis]|uniref:Polysaccharide biosynthesis/export protein n=1 Tax=Oleiphilus messinensis TaxID=141451 RepID=A0A1Y0I6U6_9GAMM|nr:XrtA/PEP-CTERM system exopolysaccharide export protein [Oleiphilus messinensis]ARU56161.1 polysaccharide biosynthesis/export protein [Oleiphilus messinensis]
MGKHVNTRDLLKISPQNTLPRLRKACTYLSALILLVLTGCSSKPMLPEATVQASATESPQSYKYLIGPYDEVNVFVWGNPEISGTFEVRPDGMITTSLVEDIPVSGKTPTEVARHIEKALSVYIRDPIVSVSVLEFVGPFSEQVRIIGEASQPRAIPYARNMTLLDVMINVNGLTEFAAGNNATLVRVVDNQYTQYGLRIDDLVNDGDITANVDMLPGDIIIIPEAWF